MLRTPPPIALGTYFLIVTSSPAEKGAPLLFQIRVNSTYAQARWLHIFSGIAIPANGTAPILTPHHIAASTNNIVIDLTAHGLPINPNGLVIVASTDRDTLTKDTSATWDITALVEDWDTATSLNPGDSTAGDLTNGVGSLTVWNDASGPKRLKRLQIINGESAVRYACVYAENTPDSGSKMASWMKLTSAQKADFFFGRGGLSPLQEDADGTLHDACVVVIQPNLTQGTAASETTHKIRATYE